MPSTLTVWSVARTAIIIILGVIELAWLIPWAYILATVISSSARIGDIKGMAQGPTSPLMPIGLIASVLGLAWAVRTIVRPQQSRLGSIYDQPSHRRLAVVVTLGAIVSVAVLSLNLLAVPRGYRTQRLGLAPSQADMRRARSSLRSYLLP